jgi:hypothetical protein
MIKQLPLFDLGTHFAHPDTYRSLALIAEYQGFFRTARLLESSAVHAEAVHYRRHLSSRESAHV